MLPTLSGVADACKGENLPLNCKSFLTIFAISGPRDFPVSSTKEKTAIGYPESIPPVISSSRRADAGDTRKKDIAKTQIFRMFFTLVPHCFLL